MRKAFQRESDSTHRMFRHLFESTGIEQPPVQTPLALPAPPAHQTVMPPPDRNETADQHREKTVELEQQDQMKYDNTVMVSPSIEASPLLCNDSAAVDPHEFEDWIADESPKQTHDQCTEDTPNETADHLIEKTTEDTPKETADQHKDNIASADTVLLTNADRAADESPKQTNDQRTEDTPNETADHHKDKTAEETPK